MRFMTWKNTIRFLMIMDAEKKSKYFERQKVHGNGEKKCGDFGLFEISQIQKESSIRGDQMAFSEH
jgi:hypothetical protein